jgi:hypothetical protein
MVVEDAHAICDRIEQALIKHPSEAVINIHIEPEKMASSMECRSCRAGSSSDVQHRSNEKLFGVVRSGDERSGSPDLNKGPKTPARA